MDRTQRRKRGQHARCADERPRLHDDRTWFHDVRARCSSGGLIVLPPRHRRPDHMQVMHPLTEIVEPVLGHPSWLVERGHGSFITVEFGEPELQVREPKPRKVHIEGAPEKTLQRSSFVTGQWHLWIYCCQWSLMLGDAQLAHCESDDVTMHRALRVLNGQELQAVEIEPADGRTKFSFDLGCSLFTLPAEAGVYEDEPVEQWYLYLRSGPVL